MLIEHGLTRGMWGGQVIAFITLSSLVQGLGDILSDTVFAVKAERDCVNMNNKSRLVRASRPMYGVIVCRLMQPGVAGLERRSIYVLIGQFFCLIVGVTQRFVFV
ncbi:MAG: hypothetical protein BWY68_00394 [bacterium ADurb.Bin400]|nr:MAG: hypothetical protein BWY68_00394 [bacterium ADurb.Bin400]